MYNVETTADGVPFMVMERLHGHDLASVIASGRRLEIAEAIDWILQAGEAIAQAHKLGIIHRDLKPANLFLDAGDWRSRVLRRAAGEMSVA